MISPNGNASGTPRGPEIPKEIESRLRQMNEALLVSSIRQHELADEARKAWEVARLNEERCKILIAAAPTAVFSCNFEGVIQAYNQRAADLWGCEPVCGVDRQCGSAKLWLPDGTLLPHDQSPIMEVLRTGIPALGVELVIERPDGVRLPVLLNFAPLKDEHGETTGAICSFMDIGERKLAEEELRESERRLQIVLESVPQMMFTTTAGGDVDYVNARWISYSGLSFEQLSGGRWKQLVHSDDLEASDRLWQHSIDTGEPFEMEYRCRRNDGQYRWHLSRALAMFGADGHVTMWIGSSTDIHPQKELEQLLERRVSTRTADLAEALHELEGFSYTVAHDLRAPLRAIIFTSKLLLQEASGELTEDQKQMLVSQAGNAQKLAQLTDDLLQFSRLSRLPVERTPIDVSALALSVSQEENQAGSQRPCSFHIQEGMTCNADRGLLRLVFANLIQNACKFSPEGGTVSVGESSDRGRTAFYVRDHGIGFDIAYSQKIFVPFERLHSEDEYPGTGIGLATVKRIVERHGGEVWAESQIGNGTTVFFTLDCEGQTGKLGEPQA